MVDLIVSATEPRPYAIAVGKEAWKRNGAKGNEGLKELREGDAHVRKVAVLDVWAVFDVTSEVIHPKYLVSLVSS